MASKISKSEMERNTQGVKIASFLSKPVSVGQLITVVQRESKARLETLRECKILEKIFIEEAQTIIDDMEPSLLSLEQDRANTEKINAIYRGAHTLKGSSGVLDTDVITRYIHKYEDIISGIKKGEIAFSDGIYEILLKGLDRIKELVQTVSSKVIRTYQLEKILPELSFKENSTEKVPDLAQQPVLKEEGHSAVNTGQSKSKEVVSVPLSLLDELSGHSGEITVIRNMVNRLVRSLERQYSGNKDVHDLSEMLEEMHKINSIVQSRIVDIRKIPLTSALKPIPRIVRDLSKELGKNIKLHIEGENLRVDNSLATVCANSLIHLVRNSLDHGIENSKDRVAAGKNSQGVITIRCSEGRDEVNISVGDDGRGLDPAKISKKAIENKLFTSSQIAAMSEQEIFSVIFSSGFSTAAAVTDVSGRGVGTDMVKSSVESVGGNIKIESKSGSGSTFHLCLPIPKSVMIISSLLVLSDAKVFAVPQDNIIRVFRLELSLYRSMVQEAATAPVLRHDVVLYPLINLRAVMDFPAVADGKETEFIDVLLLRTGSLEYALKVDGIFDSEEIVVKTVHRWANSNRAFAGSTFLADGTVGLILDIKGIGELGGLSISAKGLPVKENTGVSVPIEEKRDDFLLFQLDSSAVYGVPLVQVFRLEEICRASIQQYGDERMVIYRGGVMPIQSIHKALSLPVAPGQKDGTIKNSDMMPTIVARTAHGFIGLEVDKVLDIATTSHDVSAEICDRQGIAGNVLIRDLSVTVLDLDGLITDFKVA